jgi:hypothetical protein
MFQSHGTVPARAVNGDDAEVTLTVPGVGSTPVAVLGFRVDGMHILAVLSPAQLLQLRDLANEAFEVMRPRISSAEWEQMAG